MGKSKIRIGFLGFGEAASVIGKGLVKEGLTDIIAYDKLMNNPLHRNRLREKAKKSGVKLVLSIKELAKETDLILSLVVPSAAEKAAREISFHLDESKIYADMNSTSPMVKRKIADIVESHGSNMVDATILGSVPSCGHKVPILICGSKADKVKNILASYGMNIKTIKGEPGRAAAVKMVRSVFMKGIEALFLETLISANLYGVENIVLKSIAESMDNCSFMEILELLVKSNALHAERKTHEMAEVIVTLKDKDIRPIMSQAARDCFAWSTGLGLSERFSKRPPSSYKEVVTAILRQKKKQNSLR